MTAVRRRPTWGRVLRRLREVAVLTQTEAANHIDVGQPMISRFESGHCWPSIEQYIALCELFEAEILIIGDDESFRLNKSRPA